MIQRNRPIAAPCSRWLSALSLIVSLISTRYATAQSATIDVAMIGDPQGRLARQVLLDTRLQRVPVERAKLIWAIATDQRIVDIVASQVRAGKSAIVIAGDAAVSLAPLGLVFREFADTPLTLRVRSSARPSIAGVVWDTAPQVRARWKLGPVPRQFETLLENIDDSSPVIFSGVLGRGRLTVISVALANRKNYDFICWPYFNYWAWALTKEAIGERAEPFAAWEHSPVPTAKTGWILVPVLGFAWLLTLFLFARARRYSRRHPEIVENFFCDAAKPGTPKTRARWQAVGFARPLAGFLTLAAILFLLIAPYYWLKNVFIPNDVQPFPQARGIWDFAWEALQVAWFLFDAGTFVAFVKYFAEFRVKDPAEAVKSVQFFVWWQILTGLVQITFASLAAIYILPHTRYGYTSSFLILIALGQYPGFFGVLTFFFQAYQRYDYNVGLDLLSDWILRFVLQVPFVLYFRAWGAADPAIGEALGAALGIGLGFHASTLMTFGIGSLLYRRLGLRLLPLVLVHFDLKTAKRMLSYGLRVVLGKFFFRAAQTIDKVVLSLLLLNYTEWMGLKGQIYYDLLFIFPIAYRFFETAMAALSESYGNGKPVLTQYYVVRFIQVGSLYTAVGLSLMLALGPAFVREAMDPQWARVADYLLIAAIGGAFSTAAWLSDMLQKAAERPGLFAAVLGVEQTLRIGLFFLFIPAWQFTGYYISLILTVAIKVIGAWAINHRLILRLRFYTWQMLLAPALTGLLNFLVLRGAVAAVGVSGRWPMIIFFFAAALFSFLSCFFFCGLVGGYDRAFAQEMQLAGEMGGPLKPLTKLFYYCARAGWQISPLHGRFPVTIADEAAREAEALQAQINAQSVAQASER